MMANRQFYAYAVLASIIPFCFFALLVPRSLGAVPTFAVKPNLLFKSASDGGFIAFEDEFVASKLHYYDEFLMLDGFNGEWSVVGFKCSPQTANLTIGDFDKKELIQSLNITINAPTTTQSTIKIYVADLEKPTEVTGADYWSYNYDRHTTTIKVVHTSPHTIVIMWEFNRVIWFFDQSMWTPLAIMAVVPIVLAATMIVSATKGEFELNMAFVLTIVSVELIIAIIIYAALSQIKL